MFCSQPSSSDVFRTFVKPEMELFVTKLKDWTQLNFAKKELHLRFCCSPKYDSVFVYQKNNVQILHEMLLKVCFNVFLITSF